MQKGIFLTPDRLGKILSEYQTGLLPIFQRRWRYYEGRQNIINKIVEDDARPCNIIVCNFIKNIVDTYEYRKSTGTYQRGKTDKTTAPA